MGGSIAVESDRDFYRMQDIKRKACQIVTDGEVNGNCIELKEIFYWMGFTGYVTNAHKCRYIIIKS